MAGSTALAIDLMKDRALLWKPPCVYSTKAEKCISTASAMSAYRLSFSASLLSPTTSTSRLAILRHIMASGWEMNFLSDGQADEGTVSNTCSHRT